MVTTALLSLMLATSQVPTSLASELAGQLLCVAPDESQKTCQSISFYRPMTEGKFSVTSEAVVVLDERSIIFTVTGPVMVKNESVCSVLRPSEVAAARLKVAGRPLSVGQMAAVRAAISKSMAEYLNKESCTVFEDTQEGLVARTKVNGVYDPGLEGIVKWVDPAEGYRLASH